MKRLLALGEKQKQKSHLAKVICDVRDEGAKVASLMGLAIHGSWRLVNSQGQVLLKSHSSTFSSPDLTL